MTRFLSHPDQSVLLADLAGFGFVFLDEEGNPRNPNKNEVIGNFHNAENPGTIAYERREDDCIYLGHVPIGEDENGNTIFSTDFCANVTDCTGHVFATEIPEPANPYNKFAGT